MFKGLVKSQTTAEELAANLEYKNLGERETKEIITPFAFTVNPGLFGLPLASPSKRAIAFCLDFIFIAMLSSAGGEVLAIGIAIMFYRMSSKKMLATEVREESSETELQSKQKRPGKVRGRKRRAFYRLVASFIIFVLLADFLPPLFKSINELGEDDNANIVSINGDISGQELGFKESIALAAIITEFTVKAGKAECQDIDCWRPVFQRIPEQLQAFELPIEKFDSVIEELVEVTELPTAEQRVLASELKSEYGVLVAAENTKQNQSSDRQSTDSQSIDSPIVEPTQIKAPAPPNQDEISASVDAKLEAAEDGEKQSKQKNQVASYEEDDANSLTDFIMGFIEEDLGVGFGWAAFYYTVFTAWWRGKTPGKHMVGIKVVQLDGTDLSVWESFERQGGYAAGIATGLLGFLRVYWDPNRQAIHDKISDTVVIDLHRLKRIKLKQAKQS